MALYALSAVRALDKASPAVKFAQKRPFSL